MIVLHLRKKRVMIQLYLSTTGTGMQNVLFLTTSSKDLNIFKGNLSHFFKSVSLKIVFSKTYQVQHINIVLSLTLQDIICDPIGSKEFRNILVTVCMKIVTKIKNNEHTLTGYRNTNRTAF